MYQEFGPVNFIPFWCGFEVNLTPYRIKSVTNSLDQTVSTIEYYPKALKTTTTHFAQKGDATRVVRLENLSRIYSCIIYKKQRTKIWIFIMQNTTYNIICIWALTTLKSFCTNTQIANTSKNKIWTLKSKKFWITFIIYKQRTKKINLQHCILQFS